MGNLCLLAWPIGTTRHLPWSLLLRIEVSSSLFYQAYLQHQQMFRGSPVFLDQRFMGLNTPMNGVGAPMPPQGLPGQAPLMTPMGQPPPPYLEYRIQEMNHRLSGFFNNKVCVWIVYALYTSFLCVSGQFYWKWTNSILECVFTRGNAFISSPR